MAKKNVHKDARIGRTSADKAVSSPPVPAVGKATAATSAPRIREGGPGSAVRNRVSELLPGSKLEGIAGRVLSRRGIDIADVVALKTMRSIARPRAGRGLRDAMHALRPELGTLAGSVAGKVPLTVIPDGGDTRERVFGTDLYPFSAIAALEITSQDDEMWLGTGWFISPRTLVTAGHCVFMHRHGGWVKSIRVVPGCNGTVEPFGAATATKFESVDNWVNRNLPASDYGAVILPEGNPLGGQVGTFGIGTYGDADLREFTFNVVGYPGDKKDAEAKTMWFDAQKARNVTPQQMFYDIDTEQGQSGSPVYIVDGDQRIATAIHNYGADESERSNYATRINANVMAILESWKK